MLGQAHQVQLCCPDGDGVQHHGAHSRDEIQEAGEWLIRVVPHVAELHHHLLLEPVINDGHCQWRRLVGQEVAVVRALQVQLQV